MIGKKRWKPASYVSFGNHEEWKKAAVYYVVSDDIDFVNGDVLNATVARTISTECREPELSG